jgi:hypothetical protein
MGKLISSSVGAIQVEPFIGPSSPKLEEIQVIDSQDLEHQPCLPVINSRANYKSSRYSSPIIPVRVGPHAETFPVHRDILTKSEYFRKALDGEFREAGDQAIDLPEEDPDIFSFVIAYLYEEKFVPIKPMAMALGERILSHLAKVS